VDLPSLGMIRPDRELLADLSQFNRALGLAVMEMIHRQDGGELPAEGWQRLADQFRAMSETLDARAADRLYTERKRAAEAEAAHDG